MQLPSKTLLAYALPALLSWPVAAGAEDRILPGDPSEGRRLFSMHCAACHGEAGRGDGRVRTAPPAPDLTEPARMNLLGDRQLFELIREGGGAHGRKETMPGFDGGLSDLEIWGIVAYLRDRHLSVTDFFPHAAAYFGETYTIDEWGLARYEEVTGRALPEEAHDVVVLGIYRGTQPPDGPRLVPDTPRAIAQLDREAKVGYIAFVSMEVPGVSGEHALGISMNNEGRVFDIKVNTDDRQSAERIEQLLSRFHGEGQKGRREPFPARGAPQLARAWTYTYFRAMEGVVMFDKAERERHWADSALHGEDDAARIEEGEFEVD